MIKIINIPDISPPDDDFTNLQIHRPAAWVRLSGLPSSPFEKSIKRVRLSRYRGAIQAANAAERSDLVISHLPAMTVATSIALRAMNKRTKHLAFAFNFTQKPYGVRLAIIKRALATVDHFVVFSHYERQLYSTHFGIDPRQITALSWAQDRPPIADSTPDWVQPPYFCAVGGEGRDIALVLRAAETMRTHARFVIITRPHLVSNLKIPSNTTIITNAPLSQTWAIAKKSLGILVPLIAPDTCCGHITIVSAKILGIPIVTTESVATAEYVNGREGILVSPAGDLDRFIRSIEELFNNQQNIRRASFDAIQSETELHSRKHWEEFLNRYIDDE